MSLSRLSVSLNELCPASARCLKHASGVESLRRDDGFVSECLSHYDNSIEEVVQALVMGNLPPHLAEKKDRPPAPAPAPAPVIPTGSDCLSDCHRSWPFSFWWPADVPVFPRFRTYIPDSGLLEPYCAQNLRLKSKITNSGV